MTAATAFVTGVTPHPGERVFVSGVASYDVKRPTWVLVERTRSAFLPGWVYVIGRPIKADGSLEPRVTLFCVLDQLRVARDRV
jgi:hypothetical protein